MPSSPKIPVIQIKLRPSKSPVADPFEAETDYTCNHSNRVSAKNIPNSAKLFAKQDDKNNLSMNKTQTHKKRRKAFKLRNTYYITKPDDKKEAPQRRPKLLQPMEISLHLGNYTKYRQSVTSKSKKRGSSRSKADGSVKIKRKYQKVSSRLSPRAIKVNLNSPAMKHQKIGVRTPRASRLKPHDWERNVKPTSVCKSIKDLPSVERKISKKLDEDQYRSNKPYLKKEQTSNTKSLANLKVGSRYHMMRTDSSEDEMTDMSPRYFNEYSQKKSNLRKKYQDEIVQLTVIATGLKHENKELLAEINKVMEMKLVV
ncbi:unnamed protein product [Moneuplotes crassus]|uniref:Uncharacterized protein n=1 Tax=Euplotes crassus TaxID=5936 RepID=A0AAD1UL58_EUPCR|nr:unnamed protein product [Moneuplotes crassus]